MPIQPDQEQIRNDRQRHGARHALGLLRHLHLAQMEAALQFFYGDLHAPTPRVYTQDRPCVCLREIGHDDLHFFRPIVTPFLREYDRDIAELMQGGAARKDPIIPSMPVGCMARSAGVAALGQVLHQVSEVFAIRKFPCPRHGKDISNPSCYLLEIHELLRSNEGASWISLGEEEAHGRDDYSDILPV
jgi:hypothetical protein